jgi:transitional endoplasmic reticulum ATPase
MSASKPANSVLPPWANELRDRYLAGEASMFLLHGNVRDLFAWPGADGEVEWLPLGRFLESFLSRTKEIVVAYNCSEGLEFASPGMNPRFARAINARRTLEGRETLKELPRTANKVLPLLEDLVTDQTQSAAVVLDYVETIVPSGELSFMNEADKANFVTLQRWASDPALLQSDNLVILITEQLGDLQRRVVSSAQLHAIEVQLPNEVARAGFLDEQDLEDIELELGVENLARHTAGLTLVHLRGLLRQARQSGDAISFRTVTRRKKAIIEQECHGLVEFLDPGHDFSHVGGMAQVKADLMRVADAVKKGHRNRVPMGLIFVGPMGTGKTYVAEAFAAESGLTCLKFKNFREKWVGSTEGNLEKILQVVDALGYVLLIIDEADRSLSSGSEGDGGTSSRVIARLKEFMSDTSHRGRVVILLMTNRPDKLDADLKRPGRFDVKIPFFFPEADSERRLILEAQFRKNELELETGATLDNAVVNSSGYSAAELEAVLLAAAGNASADDRLVLSQEDLDTAVADVIPSRDLRMLQFMEMLAVFEASSRRMLPERYQDIETDEVLRRLDLLRAALGRRVV